MSRKIKVLTKVISGILLIAIVLAGAIPVTIPVKGAESTIQKESLTSQSLPDNLPTKTESKTNDDNKNSIESENVISIELNEDFTGYQDETAVIKLYQITMKNTGMLRVTLTPQDTSQMHSVKLQILDSNKEKLGVETLHYTNHVNGIYGSVSKKIRLNKGTYYIQVNTSCGYYDIRYTNTRMIDIAGSSMEDAMPIKVDGIGVKGFCTVSDSTADVDWFKFTLTKYKELDIKIISETEGALLFELCNSDGETYFKTFELENSHFGLGKALTRGTYYIKIYKDNKNSSGTYSIKVNETSLFR